MDIAWEIVRRKDGTFDTAAKERMRKAVERIDNHIKASAAYSARRARFERGLELLHAKSTAETTAEEAATNEGMAEKPEAKLRPIG